MIAYFEILREKREKELADEQADCLFQDITNKVLSLEPSDSYEFPIVRELSARYADTIIENVVSRFAKADVVVKAAYWPVSQVIDIKVIGVLVPTNIEQTGIKYYWSRIPGNFVNKLTGNPISIVSDPTTGSTISGPSFTGSVREWYETLTETIIDVSNTMHRQYHVMPNKIISDPWVVTILESSVLFRPTHDSVIAEALGQVGTLCNKFDVYKQEQPKLTFDDLMAGKVQNPYIEVCVDVADTRRVGLVEILDMTII